MTGVDITHGGAIAVDTQALIALAARMCTASAALQRAEQAVRRAEGHLGGAFLLGFSGEPAFRLYDCAGPLAALRDDVDETAQSVLHMAEIYELVELRIQADLHAQAEIALPPFLAARLEALRTPERETEADALLGQWQKDSSAGLIGPSVLSPVLRFDPYLYLGGLSKYLGARRTAVIPPNLTLTGTADPVALTPIRPPQPRTAPDSLEASLGRLPSAEKAQLRVEKYTMPDGAAQFVLYIDGTQSGYYGGKNPWDMKSNTELYTNQRSASYQAAEDALAAAGAKPGDTLHLWGYSQGGMIASRLAMHSAYDVRTLVTAGSPVEPSLGPEVLTVQLRHTDDPVSGLSGAGSGAGTGSPDSFVAQRKADPPRALHDLWLHTHLSPQYRETAALVDASGDSRVAALDALWAELGQATHIEATEYRAERDETPWRRKGG